MFLHQRVGAEYEALVNGFKLHHYLVTLLAHDSGSRKEKYFGGGEGRRQNIKPLAVTKVLCTIAMPSHLLIKNVQ